MLSYRELAERAWTLRLQGILTLHEHDMYNYLLHRAITLNSVKFVQSTSVICAILGINRNALTDRRSNLQELGLIRFWKGGTKRLSPHYKLCNMLLAKNQLLMREAQKEEKEEKEEKEDLTKNKLFFIPNLQEVVDYCAKEKSIVSPERFYNYYQSKNWYVGTTKMRDWQAAIRSWEQTENKNKKEQHNFARHNNTTDYVKF